ncbi:glycosyltransferase [Gelidibacter gilvus]|uniref:Glycosyltransferase n=1 Tax=Gelidibacter gilvus TaxID=59602 RepID=A0A4Q0XDL1_9FLAO|nr:glycosyltransferase [Gelidibacter gilvus]RXJ46032.1 glycosyltransferase [Gelidibacter gilvus]
MKVSIIVLSYNHESYLHETLQSLTDQKTKFEYEILVGDDCSPDNSRLIIDQFYGKHPNKIKRIYPEKNLGPNANYLNCLRNAKGQFIAFCEGDDYWIDENKLQKQVDFLEQNPKYGGVCGEVISRDIEKKSEERIPLKEEGVICFEDIVFQNKIHSNTILFRNELINIDSLDVIKQLSIGDWYLHLLVTMQRPYYYLPQYLALYRVHNAGIFSKKSDFFKAYQKSRLLAIFMKSEGNDENSRLIKKSLESQVFTAFRASGRDNKKELKELFNIMLNHKIIKLNRSLIRGAFNFVK